MINKNRSNLEGFLYYFKKFFNGIFFASFRLEEAPQDFTNIVAPSSVSDLTSNPMYVVFFAHSNMLALYVSYPICSSE